MEFHDNTFNVLFHLDFTDYVSERMSLIIHFQLPSRITTLTKASNRRDGTTIEYDSNRSKFRNPKENGRTTL